MQFITYFLISLVSFLGLLIGIILVKIAPEEQKPLGRYFAAARQALLLLIFAFVAFYFAFVAFYYSGSAFYLIVLVAYFIFAVIIEFKVRDMMKKSMIASSALGVLFFLSMQNTNLFAIVSSLILLYGIPTASLAYNKKEKNQYKILFYNAGFLVVAGLLYFA